MAFKSVRGMSLEATAHQLNTTRPKLIKALKEHNLLMRNGLPFPDYIKQGLFVVETREFVSIADIKKQYAVTLVTGAGLAYLHQVMSEAA